MHELKQFIDNSLQELPMGSKESWILPNHIPANKIIHVNASPHIEQKRASFQFSKSVKLINCSNKNCRNSILFLKAQIRRYSDNQNMRLKIARSHRQNQMEVIPHIMTNSYMMLLAITALLSFPFVISHKFSKSRMTITRNLFSCKSTKVRSKNDK